MQSVAPSSAPPNRERRPPHAAHHRRRRGPDRAVGRAQALRQARRRAAVTHRRHPHGVVLRRRGRPRPTATSSPGCAGGDVSVVHPATRRDADDPAMVAALDDGDRRVHHRRQPGQARPEHRRHACRGRHRPRLRARRRRRRHLGRRLDHEPLHDLARRGGAHPPAARQPDLRRARSRRGRHHRPALRPARPLRPAHVDGRGLPEPARHGHRREHRRRDPRRHGHVGHRGRRDLRHRRPQRRHRRPRRAPRGPAAGFRRGRALAAHGQLPSTCTTSS